jgi:hypothetical protein
VRDVPAFTARSAGIQDQDAEIAIFEGGQTLGRRSVSAVSLSFGEVYRLRINFLARVDPLVSR